MESLSLDRFSVISKELLGQCNSDAYVFINQPGLRKQDFSTYKKEFISLQRYIYSASTALDFESVQLPSNDTFNELINYVNGECKIDKFISVEGNKTNGFEEYIDTAKRVIRIDYPILPEHPELRRKAISDFDKFLRTVLAQVPSPAQTIVYTAIEPGNLVVDDSIPIFPEIFRDSSMMQEIEKNDHDLRAPRDFNPPRPKFARAEAPYLSVFDSQFIAENYDLLKLIFTSLFGFLLLQFVIPRKETIKTRARPSSKPDKSPAELKQDKRLANSAGSTHNEDKPGKLEH